MNRLFLLPAVALIVVAAQAGAQTSTPRQRGLFDTGGDPVIIAANEARMRQADNLRIEGDKALRKGDTARAVTLLLQSLKIDGNEMEARILLADIYGGQNRPADVVDILRPYIYRFNGTGYSPTWNILPCMKYILALLDMRQWTEAATLYEQGMNLYDRKSNLQWCVEGYGGEGEKEHWLPDAHFSPDVENIPGLRAQAHLILGARRPQDVSVTPEQRMQYMLDHLRLALKNDARSLDAQFLIGVLLREMGRADEARTAFARAMQIAPAEMQPEIKAAMDKLNRREELKEAYKTHPAKGGKGYYEVVYTDEAGNVLPVGKDGKTDLTNRHGLRRIVTTFYWRPASPSDMPSDGVIVSEDGVPDPDHPGKFITRYHVIQNPGLRFTIPPLDLRAERTNFK